MLRPLFSSTFFDGYTAGIFAGMAYGRSSNYLIAGLVGLVAMAIFRIQRLIKYRREGRR